MTTDRDIPRWTRRLDEFERMVALLVRTDAITRDRPLTEAEEAGMVQFFEMSVELAWKTLALLMRHDGVALPTMAPMPVFREAARLGYSDDPDDWMAAIERRNLMSHTYDPDAFRLLVADIGMVFLPLMLRLCTALRQIAAG